MKSEEKFSPIVFNKEFSMCPVCNSSNIELAFNSIDGEVSMSGFTLYLCKECYLYFVNPQPTSEWLEEYYNTDYLARTTQDGIVDFKTHFKNFGRGDAEKILLNIKRVRTVGRVLDIGCGTGGLVKVLHEDGFNVTGIDISKDAIIKAQELGPLNLINISIENFNTTERFDLIILYGVIEHLREPQKIIEKISNFLNKDGNLLIYTPLVNGLQFSYLREYAGLIMPPYHLFNFSYESILSLTKRFKLIPILTINASCKGWLPSIARRIGIQNSYNTWCKNSDFRTLKCSIEALLDDISDKHHVPTAIEIYFRKE